MSHGSGVQTSALSVSNLGPASEMFVTAEQGDISMLYFFLRLNKRLT